MVYRSKAVCFLGALALMGASTALLVPQPASAQARAGAAGGLKGGTLVIGGLIGLGAIGAAVAMSGGGKKTTPPPKSP